MVPPTAGMVPLEKLLYLACMVGIAVATWFVHDLEELPSAAMALVFVAAAYGVGS